MRLTFVSCVLLLICLLIPPYASAGSGGEAGNGGEVVACRDSNGTLKSLEMLDSFEGRILHEMPVDLGDSSLSLDQKIQIVLQRMNSINPTRAALYEKWAKNFFNGVSWVQDALPATPDVDPSVFPGGCRIEQIAIQKNNRHDPIAYNLGPSLRINSLLWKSLTTEQQAVLVIHEIIYHEALSDEVKSAEPIRYLNQIYVGNKLQSFSAHQFAMGRYAKLLSDAGLVEFDYRGLRVLTEDFYAYGLVSSADQVFQYRGFALHIPERGKINFIGDVIWKVDLAGSNILNTPAGKFNVTGQVSFDYDKNPDLVYEGFFYADSNVLIPNDGSAPCAKGSVFYFSGSRLASCSKMSVGGVLKTASSTFKVERSGELYFSDDGEISYRLWAERRSPLLLGGTFVTKDGVFEINGLGNITVSPSNCYYGCSSLHVDEIYGTLKSPKEIEINGNKVVITGNVGFGFEISEDVDRKAFKVIYFEPVKSQSFRFGDLDIPVKANANCQNEGLRLNGVHTDYRWPDQFSVVLDRDMSLRANFGELLLKSGNRASFHGRYEDGSYSIIQGEPCL